MGKTTLALDIALNAAESGEPVLIFSLEMSAHRIADRLICAKAMVPGLKYRQGEVDVTATCEELAHLPVMVYDKRVSTAEIRSKCLRVKAKHGLKLVLVDFLTLIKDKRDSRASTADHVGEIAQNLQEIGKELDVPLIVMSQMNRGSDGRENKTPQLSDLRASGNIEEAADVVAFIHRPDYYGQEGEPQIIVAKNRDGPTGRVNVKFFSDIPTFRNLGRDEDAPF